MVNSEKQPNISNSQFLESEMALTKQEIIDFSKLTPEEQDKRRNEMLSKLFDLQKRLDFAIQQSIQSGQIDKSNELMEQLEREIQKMEDLEESLEKKWTEPTLQDKVIFQEIRTGVFRNVNLLETVTDEIADILAEQNEVLDLNRLIFLSDTAAERLSRHKSNLYLNGLKFLSDTVAGHLSHHKGGLFLIGLCTISDTVAKHLAEYRGDLDLQRLDYISDTAAKYLSHYKGVNIYLNSAIQDKEDRNR